MANEQQRALLSQRRGKLAARITDPQKRRDFIAQQGAGGMSDEELETETSRETNRQALTSYKHGGKVKQTGPAMLHKGERVLNESEAHQYDWRKQKSAKKTLMKVGK